VRGRDAFWIALINLVKNLRNDGFRLVIFVLKGHKSDGITLITSGPEHLIVSHRVVFDQGVGQVQNPASRAIILFKTNYFGVGPLVTKAQDVLHLCPTPTVDRLVVITNYTHITMTF